MDRTTLAVMARKHWQRWLPRKTRELKEAWDFDQATQLAAGSAQRKIEKLMAQG